MIQVFDAVFEDGVLRPLTPVVLPEHQQVRVTVNPEPAKEESNEPDDPLEGCVFDTGIADLAEHFDDYRFGRRKP